MGGKEEATGWAREGAGRRGEENRRPDVGGEAGEAGEAGEEEERMEEEDRTGDAEGAEGDGDEDKEEPGERQGGGWP